jgi:hypothetical protein
MRVLRDTAMALPLLLVVFVYPVFAQSTQASPASTEPDTPKTPTQAPVRRRIPEVPCWRQAGITPDQVNQRWKIEDQAQAKIAATCNEESTSPQQKHDKIEEIHRVTDVAIAKLIPEQQRQALNSCQTALEQKHAKSAPRKELGPCGGVLTKAGDSDMSHQH